MCECVLSPSIHTSSPDTAPHTYQNTLTAPGSGTASSSLPDLTTIEFQSGLEVPLERDDPVRDQPQQMFPYQSPPTQQGGFPASNLLLNSFQACRPQSTAYITNHAYVYQPLLPNVPNIALSHSPVQNHSLPTHPMNQPLQPHHHPFSNNIPALNLNPNANWRPSQFAAVAPGGNAIRKSPTAPNFQNFAAPSGSSSAGASPSLSRASAAYQQFHPLLPSLVNPTISRSSPYQGAGVRGSSVTPTLQSSSTGSLPKPMNIVIQPPGPPQPSPSQGNLSTPTQPPVPSPFSPSHSHSLSVQSPQTPQTLSLVQSPPSVSLSLPVSGGDSVPIPMEPTRGPFTTPGISSLPATPTITISPGLSALPSYMVAREQQALQEKFASFGMHKTDHLVRSHSEENLQQKGQKERGDLMHNPFMGNLANANSVPCVYVDSPSTENIAEGCESPTTGDSPSTSASYASSPPSVRPFWIDQHQANDFVFHGHEWPTMDGGAATTADKKPESPISHHKSLSDLNAPIDYTEHSPKTNRSLQLSLPSIMMSDLAMDDQAEKPCSPVPFDEYAVEDAVMDTLLKQEELPSLQNFDMGLLTSDVLLSSSPDSLLQRHLHF